MKPLNRLVYSYFDEPSLAVWESNEFYAATFAAKNATQLTVMRKYGGDKITWDELQKVKNDCGFRDQDAIEFYPAEDAVMNKANRRHLFILEEKHPLVWRNR